MRLIDADILKECCAKSDLIPKYAFPVVPVTNPIIDKQPTADPAKRAEWVVINDYVDIGDGTHMECSACHTWKQDRQATKYCPHCGAKMYKEKNNDKQKNQEVKSWV